MKPRTRISYQPAVAGDAPSMVEVHYAADQAVVLLVLASLVLNFATPHGAAWLQVPSWFRGLPVT